jgi:GDP-D-mannose 3',5'-epimerase
MRNKTRILVTGAGGFIGHHLVGRLKAEGYWVRGVDLKHPQYETSKADEFEILDLRRFEDCLLATRGGIDQIYNLAADMGGIGFITANHAELARNNICWKRRGARMRDGFCFLLQPAFIRNQNSETQK